MKNLKKLLLSLCITMVMYGALSISPVINAGGKQGKHEHGDAQDGKGEAQGGNQDEGDEGDDNDGLTLGDLDLSELSKKFSPLLEKYGPAILKPSLRKKFETIKAEKLADVEDPENDPEGVKDAIAEAKKEFLESPECQSAIEDTMLPLNMAIQATTESLADSIKEGSNGAKLVNTAAKSVMKETLHALEENLKPSEKGGTGQADATIQALTESVGRSMQTTFKKGSEVDKGFKSANKAAERNLQGLVKSGTDGLAKGFTKATAKGSKLDKAGKNTAQLIARNSGEFVNTLSSELSKSLGEGASGKGGELGKLLVKGAWAATGVGWRVGLVPIFIAFGTYSCAYGLKVMWNQIERYLTRPKLLLASTQKIFFKRWFDQVFGTSNYTPVDMIFSPELTDELGIIVESVRNLRTMIKNGNPNITYPNILLYGPPGTGKTLWATELAQVLGMDCAIFSGGSPAQFGIDAIAELTHLFDWAKTCPNGAVIFIDEVDSLMGDRQTEENSQDRKIINHILSLTGTRSNKILLIFTTNLPYGLDQALYDRIDQYVNMSLPDVTARQKVIALYLNKIFFNQHNGERFVKEAKKVFTPVYIKTMAEQIDGYSNRGIHGLINQIFSNTMATKNKIVSAAVVERSLQQAKQKLEFLKISIDKQNAALHKKQTPKVAVAA